MTNTEALLAQYSVTLSDARDFIYSNLNNPELIYQTAGKFGVTFDMLAELYGQSVTGEVVKSFFLANGMTANNDTPDYDQNYFNPITTPVPTGNEQLTANLQKALGDLNAGNITSLDEALADFNSFYSLITEYTSTGQALPSLEGLGLEGLFTALLSTLTFEGLSGIDVSALNVNLPNVNLANVGAVLGSEADILALTSALTSNDASNALQDFITKLADATGAPIPQLAAEEATLTGTANAPIIDFI